MTDDSTVEQLMWLFGLSLYFEVNPEALEVLIYKGRKVISVSRRYAENPLFLILFRRK